MVSEGSTTAQFHTIVLIGLDDGLISVGFSRLIGGGSVACWVHEHLLWHHRSSSYSSAIHCEAAGHCLLNVSFCFFSLPGSLEERGSRLRLVGWSQRPDMTLGVEKRTWIGRLRKWDVPRQAAVGIDDGLKQVQLLFTIEWKELHAKELRISHE